LVVVAWWSQWKRIDVVTMCLIGSFFAPFGTTSKPITKLKVACFQVAKLKRDYWNVLEWTTSQALNVLDQMNCNCVMVTPTSNCNSMLLQLHRTKKTLIKPQDFAMCQSKFTTTSTWKNQVSNEGTKILNRSMKGTKIWWCWQTFAKELSIETKT